MRVGLKDEASSKIDSLSSKITSGLGTAAKAGAAAIASGVTAVAGGTAKILKSSLDAYASFEQLTGGVETLFKESADVVEQYAARAYTTAGLSANDYMETVTSFSASLLQSLDNDTAAAAEKADRAITDMADNANKMGTSMESIQNAYQGFAKQNYTMLDNLKLGYGGTKEEMERLIDDANKLNAAQGKATQYSIDSYADIVDAIHDVQVELGFSGLTAEEAAEMVASGAMTEEEAFNAMGTTAKEAATTIEGSVNSAKAAWTNWLTGLGDDTADMTELTEELVESVATAASNIVPRAQIILETLFSTIETYAPQIQSFIAENLPLLINYLVDFVTNQLMPFVMNIFPQLTSILITNLPLIIQSLLDFLNNQLLPFLVTIFPQVLDTIVASLPMIIEGVLDFLTSAIPAIIDMGLDLFVALVENMPKIISTIVGKLPELISRIVSTIGDHIPDMVQAGFDLLTGLATGIGNAIGGVVQSALDAAGQVVDGIKNFFGIASPSKLFKEFGGYLDEGLAIGIENNADAPVQSMDDMVNQVSSAAVITPTVESGSGTSDVLSQILDKLDDLANMNIVLDTKKLVGGIAPQMDKTLGRRQTLAQGGF
jgi:phage-related protein